VSISSIVNAAGKNLRRSIVDISLCEWDDILKVNVYGMFYVTKFFLPCLSEGSVIINIASDQTQIVKPNKVAYATSKGAVLQFTKSLALDLAEKGIRAICVSPGPIDTNMIDNLSSEQKQELINSVPLKRLGTAEEVANLVYFLGKEDAGFISGVNIIIDGGVTIS
jgi:NAD(P)-dependent dehydrogenase (short-subunit alcohol dehydrogenase family)